MDGGRDQSIGNTGFRWTRSTSLVFCAAIAFVTMFTFAGVLTSDFIRFDDPRYITQNSMVLDGLSRDGTAWAFSTFFKSNWHPITWMSHMLDVELFGVDAGLHHATSLFFHVVNTILLFIVLQSATGAPARSAFVAALFALHPTHVESVAWIAERKDVLSTLFWLLSMASFIAYTRRGGAFRYAMIVTTLLLGLASKVSVVTLPFVFLLLDYWPLKRLYFDKRAIPILIEKLPLVVIAIAFSGLAILAQDAGGAVALGSGISLFDRAANALMSYGLYIGKTLWPSDLALIYPHPYLPGGTPWSSWQIAAMAAALAATTLLIWRARRHRYLTVGWLWFLGTLVPMIGLLQVGSQGMADRYTYVSCIGLYLIVAWGGTDLLRLAIARNRTLAMFGAGAFIGSITVLALVSQRQVEYWRDTLPLFEHSLAVAPGAAFLHNNLGNELFDRGNLDESVRNHRLAVELTPDVLVYHRNLSRGLRARGDAFEAALYSLSGNGVEVDSAEGQIALAKVRMQQQDYALARTHFERTIAVDPSDANAYIGLSLTHQFAGDLAGSMRVLRSAIENAAQSEPARIALAQLLAKRGDEAGARVQLQLAAGGPAMSAQHRVILGLGFVALGDIDDAITQFIKAVESNPSQADAYIFLGDALLTRGEREDAITWYRQAVMLSPESEEIRQRLDYALSVQPTRNPMPHSAEADPGPR